MSGNTAAICFIIFRSQYYNLLRHKTIVFFSYNYYSFFDDFLTKIFFLIFCEHKHWRGGRGWHAENIVVLINALTFQAKEKYFFLFKKTSWVHVFFLQKKDIIVSVGCCETVVLWQCLHLFICFFFFFFLIWALGNKCYCLNGFVYFCRNVQKKQHRV